MTMQLEIAVSDHRPVTIVTVTGELDIATGDLFRDAIRDLLLQGRTRIVIDTSELGFCDSSGLEALLDARDATMFTGGAMRLAGVHGVLSVVLDATRLTDVFVIDATPVESEAALLLASPQDVSMV
ncbi:STAS domain-containing protein [Microbispora sp. RL4-1S]|uniref:Anti-sigma factor antagonist n=1 Tax=Microbispora oryzae TaxID=2806554 RepID=A0A940WGU4_9ACTN|nr:STAS domain-containing protein [Microbispora oryzae]MBP2704543.1 STAS domain-containing protein [Microbispora oryzae]